MGTLNYKNVYIHEVYTDYEHVQCILCNPITLSAFGNIFNQWSLARSLIIFNPVEAINNKAQNHLYQVYCHYFVGFWTLPFVAKSPSAPFHLFSALSSLALTLAAFCSWMLRNIHERRRQSDGARSLIHSLTHSLTHSPTHSILINLFIKTGLNRFSYPSPA